MGKIRSYLVKIICHCERPKGAWQSQDFTNYEIASSQAPRNDNHRFLTRWFLNFKKSLFIVCLTGLTVFLFSVKTFALSEISKNLILNFNTSHLFLFDEKILNYKFEKDNLFKIEFPAGIFDSKQKMLITSVKKTNNKLTVFTESEIYNFYITVVEAKDCGIDSPPILQENESGMANFDLDSPPTLQKKQ